MIPHDSQELGTNLAARTARPLHTNWKTKGEEAGVAEPRACRPSYHKLHLFHPPLVAIAFSPKRMAPSIRSFDYLLTNTRRLEWVGEIISLCSSAA